MRRKTLLCLFALLVFSACQIQPVQDEQQAGVPHEDSSVYRTDQAKRLFEKATKNIIRSIKGEITPDKAKELNKPIMEKFNAIYTTLDPEDTLSVYKFKVQMFNKAIDVDLKYNK